MEVAQVADLMRELFPIDLQLFAEKGESQAEETEQEEQADDRDQKETKDQTFTAEYVAELRKEAAKHRTEKKKTESQLAAVLKALGVGDEVDPDKLKTQLAEKDKRIRTLALEKAFGKVAEKLGADPDLTLAVLHRKGVLDTLDADDAKFTTALEAEVKAALEANPKLKATETKKAGDSGTSGTGEGGKVTMNDLIRRAAGRK